MQDVLATALRLPDLDAAVKTIQDALGITDGDRAGYEFSVADSRTFKDMMPDECADFIASWFRGELLDAGERATNAVLAERGGKS
jgi:hypothetical protein